MGGYQNDPGTSQQEAGFGFFQNFWTESFLDNLTASATQSQAGATPITCMFSRFTTVAAAFNAVRLPPALPGLSICVINAHASNPMQVYGDTADTINGVAAATGVPQMQGSTVWYTCTTPKNPVTGSAGSWTAQGIGTGQAGAYPTYSTQTGLTATPGGNQGNSIKVAASQVQFSTVASGASATMPPAVAGMELTIVNNGANALTLFPASAAQGGVTGGDNFQGSGQNASTSQAAAAVTIYYCFNTGTWVTK